jgi:hypothetical protein
MFESAQESLTSGANHQHKLQQAFQHHQRARTTRATVDLFLRKTSSPTF